MRLMMTSVPLLNNLPSMIMVWKKVPPIKTRMPLLAITSQIPNLQDVTHPCRKKKVDFEILKEKNQDLESILASTSQSHPEF